MTDQKYWSFKFLLAGGQEQSDDQQEGTWKQVNVSTPLLTHAVTSKSRHKHEFYPSCKDDELIPKKIDEAIQMEIEASLGNLDVLSISELRKLRRVIALRLHPDRLQKYQLFHHHYEMSEINRLIDDAIKKKSVF